MDQDTKDILRSGSKALENITDVFNKLAGPLAEELGLMFGDKAREYRLRNLIQIIGRAKEMCTDMNREPGPIPPRRFLPMLEAASLEDDAALQELWAALIANTSMGLSDMPSAFIDFIKNLSPEEARILQELYKVVVSKFRESPKIYCCNDVLALAISEMSRTPSPRVASIISVGSYEDLLAHFRTMPVPDPSVSDGKTFIVFARDLQRGPVSLANLVRLGILTTKELSENDGQVSHYFFSPLGWLFLTECRRSDDDSEVQVKLRQISVGDRLGDIQEEETP